MKMIPWDPDVQTIVGRIRLKRLDLQPDFQRGDVWTDTKKRRLIDSILREWHVPPIHVVELKDGRQEVLDGKQRLTAIWDFVEGNITVDGKIEPADPRLEKFHNKKYAELDDETRERFNTFSLRFYRIQDYSPSEPGELFYRLNQPTNLTTAEQRNAFYGPARQTIKNLVQFLAASGVGSETLGFSNARMAHDDVLSRFCYSLHAGTLAEKVTASAVTDVFRSAEGFSESCTRRAMASLELFAAGCKTIDAPVRFNKATLYSWLCFIAAALEPRVSSDLSANLLGAFINDFESRRTDMKDSYADSLLAVFNDRATSRVADISSVLARDFVMWTYFARYARDTKLSLYEDHPRLVALRALEALPLASDSDVERWVTGALQQMAWGEL
jgi:hypothetical protein